MVLAHIDSEGHFNQLLTDAGSKPVIIDFFATWYVFISSYVVLKHLRVSLTFFFLLGRERRSNGAKISQKNCWYMLFVVANSLQVEVGGVSFPLGLENFHHFRITVHISE